MRRHGLSATCALVVALAASSCGGGASASGDADVVDVAPETTATTERLDAESPTMDAADEQALLEEAYVALEEYLDAYWSVEPDREYELSALWAQSLAEMHQVEARTASAVKDSPAAEGELTAELTGIVEDGDGWTIEGEVSLDLGDIVYSYDSIHLVRNDDGELVVADYCRTSADGGGPIDGCLFNGVGLVAQEATSDDGLVKVYVGPFLRAQGLGKASLMFTLLVENGGSSPVAAVGGEAISYELDNGEREVGVASSLEEMDVALPGSKATGFVTVNIPDSAMFSEPLDAGQLTLTFEDGAGVTHRFLYEVPPLPQAIGDAG